MDGYKIVYREPDGTITDTFFVEPMSSLVCRSRAIRTL